MRCDGARLLISEALDARELRGSQEPPASPLPEGAAAAAATAAELEPGVAHVLEEHLAACASCQRARRELEALQGLLREAPAPEPPPGYLEAAPGRLAPRLAKARRAGRRRRRALASAAVAAGLLVVVGLGWGPWAGSGGRAAAVEPERALSDADVLVTLDRLETRLAARDDAETRDMVETASLVVREAASLQEVEPGAWRELAVDLRATEFPARFGARVDAVRGRDPELDEDLRRVAALLQGLAREDAS